MTDYTNHSNHDNEIRRISTEVEHQTERNNDRIGALENKVQRLSLLNEAMFELLATKLSATNEDMLAMLEQVVNKRKARADAKLKCSGCGRLVPNTKGTCLYCGGALQGDVLPSPFD